MTYALPDPRFEEPNLLLPGKQPTGPVVIDWEHPLSRGLVGAWIGGSLINYVTGQAGTITGSTVTRRAALGGHGWTVTGDAVTDRIDLGTLATTDPLCLYNVGIASFFAYVTYGGATVTNGAARVIDKSDGANAANGWAIYWSTTGPAWYININGANASQLYAPGAYPTIPTPGKLGISVDLSGTLGPGGFDVSGYWNGVYTDGKNTPPTVFTTASTAAALLNWNHTTDRQFYDTLHALYIWSDRFLDAREHISLNDHPYQFWIPA